MEQQRKQQLILQMKPILQIQQTQQVQKPIQKIQAQQKAILKLK